MKKQLLFALTLLVGQICFASQSKTKTCDNNVSQVFKNVFIELPGFREIQGGSKIVVITTILFLWRCKGRSNMQSNYGKRFFFFLP